MDQNMASIVSLPISDLDATGIKHRMLHESFDPVPERKGTEFPAQDFAEGLIAHRAVMKSRAGRRNQWNAHSGSELIARGVDTVTVRIKPAGLGK